MKKLAYEYYDSIFILANRGYTMSGLGHSPTHPMRPDIKDLQVEEGHAWLWGVTGEQEWTPSVTTGKTY